MNLFNSENILNNFYNLWGKLSQNNFLQKCNLVFSPLNFYIELNFKKASPDVELTPVEWINAIKKLPLYPFVSTITFAGREAMAKNNFFDILKAASKKFKVKTILETKGLLLNNETLGLLLDYSLDHLCIIKDTNEDENDFQKVKENLKNLKNIMKEYSKNISVDIQTNLSKQNIDYVLSDYEFATNLGVEYFTISFFDESDISENDEEFNTLRQKIQKMKRYSRTKVRILTKASLCEKHCKYPNLDVTIKPSGDIYNCLCCKIGNIKDKKFKKIISSIEYKEYLNTIKKENNNLPCLKNCIKRMYN